MGKSTIAPIFSLSKNLRETPHAEPSQRVDLHEAFKVDDEDLGTFEQRKLANDEVATMSS